MFDVLPFPRPKQAITLDDQPALKLPDIFVKRKLASVKIQPNTDVVVHKRNKSVLVERKQPKVISSIFRLGKLRGIKDT